AARRARFAPAAGLLGQLRADVGVVEVPYDQRAARGSGGDLLHLAALVDGGPDHRDSLTGRPVVLVVLADQVRAGRRLGDPHAVGVLLEVRDADRLAVAQDRPVILAEPVDLGDPSTVEDQVAAL